MNTCGVRERCTQGVQSRCAIEVWLSGVSKEHTRLKERECMHLHLKMPSALHLRPRLHYRLLTLCPGAY